MNVEPSIISVGNAASIVQATPRRVCDAADALGISPVMRINAIDHFRESDVEAIAAYLQQSGSRRLTTKP